MSESTRKQNELPCCFVTPIKRTPNEEYKIPLRVPNEGRVRKGSNEVFVISKRLPKRPK